MATTLMPAFLASCSGCCTVWQSMATRMMPSGLAVTAWRTSGAYFDGFSWAS